MQPEPRRALELAAFVGSASFSGQYSVQYSE